LRTARAEPAGPPAPGRLAFRNLHTEEEIDVVYRVDGRLDPGACREIDWILRDHRTGELRHMDPALLDLLSLLRGALGTEEPFEIISGYRSPKTNAMLARASQAVSRRSLHMQGRAIDLRVPGYDLPELRATALHLHLGGVGYYPASGFVHVDVGRVRWW
jgi:uncharacterized protein YcbK (DUF882 family)